ncbi:hypothetical protein Tco_0778472 [Tanacetum coccineum]
MNYIQQPMPNPEDISNPKTTLDMALVLMAKAFKLNETTPIYNNQKSLSNPCNRHIAQPGMNMGQDRQMLMVEDIGNHVGQNVVQNPGIHNIKNKNGLSVVPRIANQNGNGKVVTARAEGNSNGNNENQISLLKRKKKESNFDPEEFDVMAAASA